MVEGLYQFRAREDLGYHNGGRDDAQLFRRDTVRVRCVDHDLALPTLSGLRDFFLRSGGIAKTMMSALTASLQRLGDDCLPDRLCDRRERFGLPPARYCDFDLLAGDAWPSLPVPIIA
jgi:hypothetical protein